MSRVRLVATFAPTKKSDPAYVREAITHRNTCLIKVCLTIPKHAWIGQRSDSGTEPGDGL